MSTTKKRPRQTKAEAERARAQRVQKKKNQYRVGSIVLFALSIFLIAVTLIKGENVWNMLRDVIFGIFGVIAYVVGPLLLYVAVVTAYERQLSKPHIILALLILAASCGAVFIFGRVSVEGSTVSELIAGLYRLGAQHIGGGVLSFVFGWTLLKMFGTAGAYITIILLLFVFLMIFTGKTLSGILNSVRKAASGAKEKHEIASQARNEMKDERERRRAEKLEEKKKQEPDPGESKPIQNIDIPLGTAGSEIEEPLEVPFDFDSGRIIDPNMAQQVPIAEDSKHINDVIRDIKASFGKNANDSNEPEKEPVSEEKTERAAESAYKYPPINLLKKSSAGKATDINAEIKANAEKLVSTLDSFGVKTTVVDVSRGPSVTRYELQPSLGVKVSRISGLADDIALNLATAGVRIEAPIPNKAAVGIEVPNKTKAMVGLRAVIESQEFRASKAALTVALGIDIDGKVRVADIAEMPHMLVAGTTGSGKSVCLNSIIISLIYKSSPDDVRMILIDPKSVELTGYNGIPHLLVPVVTDPKKAAGALTWAVSEMMKRYKLFAETGVKTLDTYNKKVEDELEQRQKSGEGTDDIPEKLPHIVIIIDELSDLMMVAPGDVEDAICRLAQLARAAGMHLIVATQRPTVDVVTGLIKANIPSRVAFAVKDSIDSRTILGMSGAEKLLGKGDMLYMPIELNKPVRLQGCFVSEEEISAVIEYLKTAGEQRYSEQVIEEIDSQEVHEKGRSASSASNDQSADPMMDSAIEVVVEAGQASTSLLQRRLKLGYARAARIVDEMEQMGIVGPQDGSKPRAVNMSRNQWLEMKMRKNDEQS